MAHNIHVDANGNAAMAYVGSRPWHGLGLKVHDSKLMSVAEGLVAGRLDWIVDRKALVVKGDLVGDDKGNITQTPEIEVESCYANVRRDTNQILGIVGPGYEIVQNTEAFSFFDSVLGEGAACLETVGALGNSGRIFAMAKMPEVAEIVPGDPVENYIALTTAHDGTSAVKCLFTNTRIVCMNTLNAALRQSKNTVSIKHTKNVKLGLAKAKEVLCASKAFWEEAKTTYRYLATQQVNKDEVKDFLRKLFPGKKLLEDEPEEVATRTQNMRDRVELLFDGQGVGSDLAGKTKWGLYNAVTHLVSHEYNGRERKSGIEVSRWENSVLGLSAELDQKAMNLLLV